VRVSRAESLIAVLDSDRIALPVADALWRGPIGDYLGEMGEALKRDVSNVEGNPSPREDADYPVRFLRSTVMRMLLCTRDFGHGGTLVLVPDQWSHTDTRLLDRLLIKYSATADNTWQRMVDFLRKHTDYYAKHSAAWERETIERDTFRSVSIAKSQLEDLEDLVADSCHEVASYTQVDGCVVMTNRLRLLGFGGEVISQSPALRTVELASDSRAETTRSAPISDYGTRHRSAFRLCSSHEDTLAFVVSQDGAIRAVKRVGSRVVVWPELEMERVL